MNKINLSINEFANLCNSFDDAKSHVVFDIHKNLEIIQENCGGIGSSLKLRIPICLNSDTIKDSVLEIDLTDVTKW